MKRGWVKVQESGAYEEVAPQTYADMVYLDAQHVGTVASKVSDLTTSVNSAAATANAAQTKANTAQTTANAAARIVVSASAPAAAANVIWIKP